MSDFFSSPFNLAKECDIDSERLTNSVRLFRLRYGLTQTDLANMVGCSKNTISSIESGSSCSINLAFRLAYVFNCSVEDLFKFFYVIKVV